MQMAESLKTDSPVKSKEKNLLLDMDIDKDFLGSWKSMSMGDDGMDFDFGPTTKGRQKVFKFDKMDMDFSLDAEFDKLSSFKMDISGLDISSPTKKSGKAKESLKEVSSGGVNRANRESFAFSFDFDEFADLGFESKKTKVDDNSNKFNNKEGFSNASSSGGSGDFLAKEADGSKDDGISLKHPASWGAPNSKVDNQINSIKDLDTRNEDDNLKSVIDDSSLLKPANSEEKETQRTIEHIQESPSSENRDSPEPLAQKVVQDSYVCSVDSNASIKGIFSDVQKEESRTLVRMASPSTQDEHNDNVRPVAELLPTRKFSAHINAQSEKGEMHETRDDNTEDVDGSDTHKADLHLESYLAPGIENLAHEDMTDKRNADSFAEFEDDLQGSGTTIDELASDKESGKVPIRSKYFKKQNGSESEKQQASDSSTKLVSIGSKRATNLPNNSATEKRSLPKVLSLGMPVQIENTEASLVKNPDNTRECLNADDIRPRNEPILSAMEEASASLTKVISNGNKRTNTLPSNPAFEKREFSTRSLESGSKFTGLSRSLPKVLSQEIPVQTENKEASHVKVMDSTRECLNADNIKPRNEPMMTTVTHDITPPKEKPVLKGSDQDSEHINAQRSDPHPSGSVEQFRKNMSLNTINLGTSSHNMRKTVVKENRISPTKPEMKTSEVSTLKVSRTTELKPKPLSSLLHKGLTSMRTKDQGRELQGSLVLKRKPSVDIKKQTPPTPSLKRKTFEEHVDIPRLTPTKRPSASPCSNIISASLEKAVELQDCNHTRVAHDKSPRLNVSLSEMDIYSSIENDGIFEKAEACSKELEDICNMLKKKHEEANDILVRAIVNNNNLLMLNHPIYQDKISFY
ncbi:hypothetical protein R6Q59_002047 [Mikania micrantha]